MLWIYEHGDKWTPVTEKSPYKDYLWRDEDDNSTWLERLKFNKFNQFSENNTFGDDCNSHQLQFYGKEYNQEFYGVFDVGFGDGYTLILVKDFPSFLSLMEKFSVIFSATSKSTYSEAEFQLDVERDKEWAIRRREKEKMHHKEQIYQVQKLYREGMTVEEIAKNVNLNESAIKFQCRSLIAKKKKVNLK